jgi:hypothetical protein
MSVGAAFPQLGGDWRLKYLRNNNNNSDACHERVAWRRMGGVSILTVNER